MFQLIEKGERPNRFQTTARDEKYHTDWGRYAISNGFNSYHEDFLNQVNLNRNFIFDRQWVLEEDTASFLLDNANQSTNRVKVVKNYIKSYVMQYIGNANIMDITMNAKSISHKAINRREEKLANMIYYTQVANNATPELSELIRKTYPIGETVDETKQIFDNLYVDEFNEGINMFLDYIKKENEFDRKKTALAFDLASSGIVLMEYFLHNGEFKWRRVVPETFFWDRSSMEPDLSDCAYMGTWQEMVPSTIFEMAPGLSDTQKEAVEMASKNYSQRSGRSATNRAGRLYVYRIYWRDFMDYEFGYVKDEYDYPYLTRINNVFEGDKEPKYTDKDLIPISDLNEYQRDIMKGKNKSTMTVDLIRYVEFIPREIVPVPPTGKEGSSDIVLDFGVFPYQDTELQNIDSVKYPIKVSTWMYHNGFVDTPISSLINPQRMINRYAAVEQQQIASSHGQSLFYDSELVEDEAQMLSNMYQGKPTAVDTKGLGIMNLMGNYGNIVGNDTVVYETLQQMMKNSMDQIIGINESMRGSTHRADKLVGVTELEIQRASLVQEPFYAAIADLFFQAMQASANVGKRVYINNNTRKLAVAIGDKYSQILNLTKEYNLEDFRVFLRREPDMQKQIAAGNNLLFALRAAGAIDENRFAELFNRATMDDIGKAMREFAAEKQELARTLAKQEKAEGEQVQREMDTAIQAQEQKETDDKILQQHNIEQDRNQALLREIIKTQKGNNR